MQIKKRLRVNNAVLVLSAISVIAVLMVTEQRVARAKEQNSIADSLMAAQFERLALRADYMRTGNERAREQTRVKNEQVGNLLKSAADKFTGSGEKKTISALIEGHESIGKIFRAIIANRQKSGKGLTPALSSEVEYRLLNQLDMRVYETVLLGGKLQEASHLALASALDTGAWSMALVFLFMGTATLINSITLNRTIATRISWLRDGAVAIGQGRLDHSIEIKGDDEFNTLANSFNEMTAKLRGSYHNLEKEIGERKQSEEALRASEERFRVAQEHSPDGFSILRPVRDSEGRVADFTWVYANAATERILGMGLPSLAGRSLLELFPGHRGSPLLEAYQQAAETGQTSVEESFYQGDGALIEHWFRVAVVSMGQDIAVLSQDITERKQAEAALKKLNEDLESRVEQRTNELRDKDQILLLQSRQAAMGEMIGNIAHQWRQPLNVLGIQIQQLQLAYDLGAFNKELLDKIVTGSMELIQHMSKTIDDFRNYFKPDKEMTEFKVLESIENTLSLLEGGLKNPFIEVEILAENDFVITGFQNEFAQAILNILVNARDIFIERVISNPKVTVKIFTEDGCTVITVTDNAGGIPEDIITKIFEPYFTSKGPQGTGIGLFMSKSIIEKNMRGRLTARNTANGAEFRIEVGNGSST